MTSAKTPNENDLNAVAMALIRIQSIYQINASSMASGQFNGVKYETT